MNERYLNTNKTIVHDDDYKLSNATSSLNTLQGFTPLPDQNLSPNTIPVNLHVQQIYAKMKHEARTSPLTNSRGISSCRQSPTGSQEQKMQPTNDLF